MWYATYYKSVINRQKYPTLHHFFCAILRLVNNLCKVGFSNYPHVYKLRVYTLVPVPYMICLCILYL